MKNPTKRQAEILTYIREFRSKYGYSPTQKEIARYFKITFAAANSHIARMAKRGIIEITEFQHRSIKIEETIDRYQLKKNQRNILVFTYGELEIPVSEFLGRFFKLVSD